MIPTMHVISKLGMAAVLLATLVVPPAAWAGTDAASETLSPAGVTGDAAVALSPGPAIPPPADSPGIAPQVSAAPPATDVVTRLAGGALFSTVDKEHSFRVFGRLHFDAAYYFEDGASMDNGFRVRRSRLGVSGKVFGDWSYKSEFDFAENTLEAKDLYIDYGGLKGVGIRVGHHKVPFSLDELTSSNSTTFLERALPVVFAPSRRLGLGLSGGGEKYSAAAMVYGRAVGTVVDGDQPLGGGARLTFAPILKKDSRVLHLGLAGALEATDNANVVTFRQRPESRIDGARLVNTGDITDAGAVAHLGAELAWIGGPFRIQGEYIHVRVLRKNDQNDVNFGSYYAQASYVFGGKYGYRDGVMRGVSPGAEGGAWELGVRYSYLGLNDDVILGGEMNAATLGVNYYANANVRLMVNYGLILMDDQGPRTDDPMILQARIQLAF